MRRSTTDLSNLSSVLMIVTISHTFSDSYSSHNPPIQSQHPPYLPTLSQQSQISYLSSHLPVYLRSGVPTVTSRHRFFRSYTVPSTFTSSYRSFKSFGPTQSQQSLSLTAVTISLQQYQAGSKRYDNSSTAVYISYVVHNSYRFSSFYTATSHHDDSPLLPPFLQQSSLPLSVPTVVTIPLHS